MSKINCKTMGFVSKDECWNCHIKKTGTHHGRPQCVEAQKINDPKIDDVFKEEW
jgi:hypothetical protein